MQNDYIKYFKSIIKSNMNKNTVYNTRQLYMILFTSELSEIYINKSLQYCWRNHFIKEKKIKYKCSH